LSSFGLWWLHFLAFVVASAACQPVDLVMLLLSSLFLPFAALSAVCATTPQMPRWRCVSAGAWLK
jgi:hypothetical protein